MLCDAIRDRITDATRGQVEIRVIRFLAVRWTASAGTDQEVMRRPGRCWRLMAGLVAGAEEVQHLALLAQAWRAIEEDHVVSPALKAPREGQSRDPGAANQDLHGTG